MIRGQCSADVTRNSLRHTVPGIVVKELSRRPTSRHYVMLYFGGSFGELNDGRRLDALFLSETVLEVEMDSLSRAAFQYL